MSDETTTEPLRALRLSRGDFMSFTVVMCGVISLLAVWLMSGYSGAKTLTLATTHQAETYTELYFSSPTNLPKTVNAGKSYSFVYHLTNKESVEKTYHTRITLVQNGTSQVISEQTIKIPDGAETSLEATFIPNAPHTRSEVIVELVDQNQSIHFWVQS